MIWESQFWKNDLLERAAKLSRARTHRNWREASLAKLEQSLMLGFYAIRKLHESDKLSSATVEQQVPLVAYPANGAAVTKLNWHHLDENYNLSNPRQERRDVLFICHQFVHSFAYCPAFDEDGRLTAVMFASDRQRMISLLQISIEDVVGLFELVGHDFPRTATYRFNPRIGDYDVRSA